LANLPITIGNGNLSVKAVGGGAAKPGVRCCNGFSSGYGFFSTWHARRTDRRRPAAEVVKRQSAVYRKRTDRSQEKQRTYLLTFCIVYGRPRV